jgi:hypothetical protein
MPTSTTQLCCLHCDAILTPKDIADGWCDSCGKRVPLSLTAGSKAKTSPVAPVDVDIPDSAHTPRWAWVVTAAVLVGVAALFLVTGIPPR